MENNIEVVAAIIKHKNKYFVAQRNNLGELGLKWEFPGGKIKNFETKEEALIREIKEELNVDIKINGFYKTVKYEYETFNLTLHSYICNISDPKLIILNEHINSKWLKKEELLTVDWAKADLPIVKKLMEE